MLTGNPISSSYNLVLTYESSDLTILDGTGSLVPSLTVTASNSLNADTASYVQGSVVDGQVVSSLTADTASYVTGTSVDGTVTSAVNADTASFIGSVVTQDFHLFDAGLNPVTLSFTNGVLTSVS